MNLSIIYPINCIFDTGAGIDLLKEEIPEPNWMSSINFCGKPRLQSAMNQKFKVSGKLLLHICIEETRVRVVLLIIKSVAVRVWLETSFIDMFFKKIFPTE